MPDGAVVKEEGVKPQWVEIGAPSHGGAGDGDSKQSRVSAAREAMNLVHHFEPGWRDVTAGPITARRVRKKPGAPEWIGCFCTTDRHLKTNDLPFEGLWIQCEECTRWCHGIPICGSHH